MRACMASGETSFGRCESIFGVALSRSEEETRPMHRGRWMEEESGTEEADDRSVGWDEREAPIERRATK